MPEQWQRNAFGQHSLISMGEKKRNFLAEERDKQDDPDMKSDKVSLTQYSIQIAVNRNCSLM